MEFTHPGSTGFCAKQKGYPRHIMDYYEKGIHYTLKILVVPYSIARHYVFIWFCLLHLLHKFDDDTK